MLYDKREEKIRNYRSFLREYYFLEKDKRENKIKEFYSTIPADSIILEAACGKVSKIRECNARDSNIKLLIGVDISLESIKYNNDVDHKIVADLENLPFKAGYFDVINLPSVVEHLENPEKVIKESQYAMKKGGTLILSTQNIFHPIMFVQRLLPLKLRWWLKKVILKSPGHFLDTFPAPYKLNSPMRIRKTLAENGFKEVYVRLWGYPFMIVPSVCLFLSMIYEKLTDIELFRIFKPNIWFKFKKI